MTRNTSATTTGPSVTTVLPSPSSQRLPGASHDPNDSAMNWIPRPATTVVTAPSSSRTVIARIVPPDSSPIRTKTSVYCSVPRFVHSRKIAIASPTSPTRFMRNAFFAAVAAFLRARGTPVALATSAAGLGSDDLRMRVPDAGAVDGIDIGEVSSVRRFVRDRVVPFEPEIEATDDIPDDLRRECADMGLFGTAIPVAYGGLGTNVETEVRLAFELGWTTPALRAMFGTNNGIGIGRETGCWLQPIGTPAAGHRTTCAGALQGPDDGRQGNL